MIPPLPAPLQRHVQELAQGEEMLQFLRQPAQQARLLRAARDGLPPLEAMAPALLHRFGPLVLEMPHRRCLTMLVDWLVAADPPAATPGGAASLLERLVAVLEVAELEHLAHTVQAALVARRPPLSRP